MQIEIQYTITIALGLMFGSFASAFIYRFHEKLNWVFDRSMCVNCKHTLAWYDLFPLFSYIFLKGRCRYCKIKVSLTYPFMELTFALTFILLSFKFHFFSYEYLLYCILFFFLLILSWYDIFYREVIDSIALPLIVILIIFNITNIPVLITAFLVFLSFSFIVMFFNGMGGGDIRIAVIAALLTGWPLFVVAFEVAVLTALICGLFIALRKKRSLNELKKTSVPLIPFFTIGILIAILYGDIIVKGFLNI